MNHHSHCVKVDVGELADIFICLWVDIASITLQSYDHVVRLWLFDVDFITAPFTCVDILRDVLHEQYGWFVWLQAFVPHRRIQFLCRSSQDLKWKVLVSYLSRKRNTQPADSRCVTVTCSAARMAFCFSRAETSDKSGLPKAPVPTLSPSAASSFFLLFFPLPLPLPLPLSFSFAGLKLEFPLGAKW